MIMCPLSAKDVVNWRVTSFAFVDKTIPGNASGALLSDGLIQGCLNHFTKPWVDLNELQKSCDSMAYVLQNHNQ